MTAAELAQQIAIADALEELYPDRMCQADAIAIVAHRRTLVREFIRLTGMGGRSYPLPEAFAAGLLDGVAALVGSVGR